MSRTLNGESLDDNIVWLNRFASPRRATSSIVTIDGVVIDMNSPISDNRIIELGTASGANGGFYGLFTAEQLIAIEELEKTGEEVEFWYGTEGFIVTVIPGGKSVQPLIVKDGLGYNDSYIGSIKLKVKRSI